MPRKPKSGGEEMPFEAAMARLNEIVGRIESGALELDAALAIFAEGVDLLRTAGARLDAAEVNIRELVEDGEGLRLDEFSGDV